MASITEDWGLSFSDLVFLADLPGGMRLEVALQISHLLRTGRFIEDWSDLAGDVVSYVASQLERPANRPTSLFDDRRSRRYRIRVGEYLGFSRPEQKDLIDFDAWLMTDVVQRGGSVSKMTDLGGRWFRRRNKPLGALYAPPANAFWTDTWHRLLHVCQVRQHLPWKPVLLTRAEVADFSA